MKQSTLFFYCCIAMFVLLLLALIQAYNYRLDAVEILRQLEECKNSTWFY